MATSASALGLGSRSSLAPCRLATLRAVRPATRRPVRAPITTRAKFETQLVVSAANAAMLALGRFVFLPYQRRNVEKAGLPVQNDQTHAAAGDYLAQEASFLTNTNDPAGFNLIDVMAWGSLGHVLAFIILATNDALRV